MRECKAHEWGTGQQMLASAHLVCSMGPCCAAVQYRRPYLTPEERELLDLQNGMEEEMAEQYKQVCVHVYPVLVCAVAWSSVQKQLPSLFCRNSLKEGESGFLNTETIPCRRPRPQVERVIGERRFMLQQPQPGSVDDDGQGGVLRWLCKWRGLPYCDSTYETRSDLEATGPPDACRLTDQPSAADCRPVPVPCCMPCLQVAASCVTTNWTASTGWPTAGARA